MNRKTRESVLMRYRYDRAQLWPFDDVPDPSWQGDDVVGRGIASRRPLRVLVVDDDEDTADTMSMLVRLWGHDAVTAYAGAAALEIAAIYRPDVLLLDIAMARMDGYQLLSHLRRQDLCRNTLVIAITGYGDAAHLQRYAEAGFDRCLVKPVEPATLEDLLRRKQDFIDGSMATTPRGNRDSSRLSSAAWPALA